MQLRLFPLILFGSLAWQAPEGIAVEYPLDGTVFPPEITAPTFIWRDGSGARRWVMEIAGGDGAARFESDGLAPISGPADPRAVAETNELITRVGGRDGVWAWRPQAKDWEEMKAAIGKVGKFRITGMDPAGRQVSRVEFRLEVSADTVGAPIFYRDVPLMPSRTKLGTIKPLAPDAVRLVGWRLRDVSQPASRLLLSNLPTCANCHSFSKDGRTMGVDVDGPDSDKGTYAMATVAPRMTIRERDVMTWNSFAGKPAGQSTIGFMSQVSPDGRHAVSTVNEAVYSANFTNYRFLQVFYPTRGILAVHDRVTGAIWALPGADDPRYVHTGATWSPDGRYLVFSRAEARDPYPEGRPLPRFANDPEELPVRYDLYRIPFNEGRGGKPEPVRGASGNGKSNTFPKISPDGKWIVFVRCRNGQLMRPDSELYILPAGGGVARRMRCNTPVMNSWHSFSPNGRWMVFSSKWRSPYTRMYLTHLDEDGNDTPPVLVENATAENRAVNIPEFVNIAAEGLQSIEVPAAEFYRMYDQATEFARAGEFEKSAAVWRQALEVEPSDARAHNNLGVALSRLRRQKEAAESYRRAIVLKPGYADAHVNLGAALWSLGSKDEAIRSWEKAAGLSSASDATTLDLLAGAYAAAGRQAEARAMAEKALALAEKLHDERLAASIRERLSH